MPAPIEVTKLSQAIGDFRTRAPKDLPEGVLEGLENVEKALGEYAPEEGEDASPGKAAARELTGNGTPGTGVPYPQAAKGPDEPSPGQKEAEAVSEAAAKFLEATGGAERT